MRVRAGDELELDDLVARLAAAAYLRTDLVEKRGDIAVRGGILDVFPPTEEHPLRIEFWGDSVEEIRYFKVADQRSLEMSVDGLWAPPCRELLLTEAVRKRAKAYAAEFPGAGRAVRQDRRGPGGGGDGVAGPGAGGPDGAADRRRARGHPPRAVRPRADPDPGRGPGAHLAGVPGGLLGRGGRRRPDPDRPRRGLAALAGRGARGGPRPGPALVVGQLVHRRHRARRVRPRGRTRLGRPVPRPARWRPTTPRPWRSRRRRSTAARPPGRSRTSGPGCARAGACRC